MQNIKILLELIEFNLKAMINIISFNIGIIIDLNFFNTFLILTATTNAYFYFPIFVNYTHFIQILIRYIFTTNIALFLNYLSAH